MIGRRVRMGRFGEFLHLSFFLLLGVVWWILDFDFYDQRVLTRCRSHFYKEYFGV